MSRTRRDFIRLSGSLALGSILAQHACMPGKKTSTGNSLAPFGIQLYSVRDVMPNDPRGVLQQLASFGYKQIESYEGPKGMFWGEKNTEFKSYLDSLGLELISSHCDINKDFERKAGKAAAIGMKYLIYNWPGSQQTMDTYKKMAERFNACGEICRKAGLKFGHHNYESSFQLLDGIYPQDYLMNNTEPDLVEYQMDIYWVVSAGQDPVLWLEKYPNRFTLSHVKDRAKGATTRDASVDLGTGSIDFPRILKAAKNNGMKYYIVEQELYPNGTSMEAARKNAEFMRKIKV